LIHTLPELFRLEEVKSIYFKNLGLEYENFCSYFQTFFTKEYKNLKSLFSYFSLR